MVEEKELFIIFYPDKKEIEFSLGGEANLYSIKDFSEIYPGKFKFRTKNPSESEESEYLEEYRNLNVNGLNELLKSLINQPEKILELLLGKTVHIKDVIYEEGYDD